MESDIIGVTSCSNCNKRFRVTRKHAHVIGKEVQCPKCHRSFVVNIQSPSPVEQAAIQQESQESSNSSTPENEQNAASESEQKPRKRRKRDEIRAEYHRQIRAAMPPLMKRLKAITEQESSSEEQVRVWCIDFLTVALGYSHSDVDTELSALGQRIDIGIKHDGRVLLVVECKRARSRLAGSSKDQAAIYAANKSADWAVVTNGQVWKLFRICPQKGKDPLVIQLFDISLLDEDGLSEYDVECLYLLTKRALTQKESEREFHLQQSAASTRMIAAIRDGRTVRVLRKLLQRRYKSEIGVPVKLSEKYVQERLAEMFVPREL